MNPTRIALTLTVLASSFASARNLTNYDALGEAPAKPLSSKRLTRPLAKVSSVAHVESRLGVPTFIWAAHDGKGSQSQWIAGEVTDLAAPQAARRYLLELSEHYNLSAADVANARVQEVHDLGQGAIIVRFRQSVDGLDVFRSELNVVMNQRKQLVAVSGYFSPLSSSSKFAQDGYLLAPQTAIATAFADLTAEHVSGDDLASTEKFKAGYEYFRLSPAAAQRVESPLLRDVRVKKVLFSLPGEMVPAFYLELNAGDPDSTTSDYVSFVVSARDGRILFRNNLTAHAANTYKVWADPTSFVPFDGPQGTDVTPHATGTPGGPAVTTFVSQLNVQLDHAGISTNDPWLTAAQTTTNGNNTRAYADIASPTGFGAGDVEADVTAASTFDRLYDVTAEPGATVDQRKASVTQLFYDVNFFHDWYYDVGFNEAAGNGQLSNFGRGGAGGDPLLAEAQDYSGTDNANMQTPSDGESPVMQMFAFTTAATTVLNITAPSNIAGQIAAGPSQGFGASQYNVTANIVLANDGTAPTQDGCQAFAANSLTGQIVLIQRGGTSTCRFTTKAANAQAAGAAAVIIYNNQTGPMTVYGSSTTITIPVVGISQTDGGRLVTPLTAGTAVTATLQRVSNGVSRDGTLDNAIVAHEWGHYISNRLVGNGNGLNNTQGGGMGEGWGDFHSMLMSVLPSDQSLTTPAWSGVYPMATYAMGASNGAAGYYFGIRRFPYSTRKDRNPLTFKHIQDGVNLPTSAPIANNDYDGSNNSQVHATGEVWCTMLWESYAALLSDSARLSFTQAQTRMKMYLVGGYKATPVSPTLLEARDAILAAAAANDSADFSAIAGAFAKRGAGLAATGPDRNATDNRIVVEDFTVGGNLTFVDATVSDDVTSCDGDGVLDNNETGKLVVRVRNTGTTTLSATTGTVASTLGQITFPQGGTLTFPTSTPGQVMTFNVQTTVAGLVGPQNLPFVISFTDPGLANVRNIVANYSPRGNFDQVNNASTTDDVEAPNTTWTRAYNPSQYLANDNPFERAPGDTGTQWFAPDAPQPEGHYLTSPKLNVAANSAFVVTYKNRWSFEADATNAYDGAVIELRVDGTTQWIDIGAMANPTYNGKLYGGVQTPRGFYPSFNPLRDRNAFVRTSPQYPAMISTTVNLGNAYAGKAVYVRFNVGSDEAAGAEGWELDDIGFSGITNRPFALIVDQGSVCNDKRPVATAVPQATVPEKTAITLTGTATDPEARPLNFLWTQLSGTPGVFLNGDSATTTFTAPSVTADETIVLSFIANDGAQNSLPSTVQVLVTNVNNAPVAQVVAQLDGPVGTLVTLDGSASTDEDGDTLYFNWRQVGGPDVTLSSTSAAKVTFTAPNVPAGTQLTFSLDVADATVTAPISPTVIVTIVPAPEVAQPEPTVEPKGCGCNSGSGALGLLVLAMALVMFRARRHAFGRAR